MGDGISNTLNFRVFGEISSASQHISWPVTNLEAGIRLIDRQELVLAKSVEGDSSEMALTKLLMKQEANHWAQKHFEVLV